MLVLVILRSCPTTSFVPRLATPALPLSVSFGTPLPSTPLLGYPGTARARLLQAGQGLVAVPRTQLPTAVTPLAGMLLWFARNFGLGRPGRATPLPRIALLASDAWYFGGGRRTARYTVAHGAEMRQLPARLSGAKSVPAPASPASRASAARGLLRGARCRVMSRQLRLLSR
ncbi:hypothetical protein ACU4GD_35850 [Cupriavidus basilensis]